MVCFSVVDQSSYKNVISKWYPEVKQHDNNVPIILVGTNVNLREDITNNKRRNILSSPITHAEVRNSMNYTDMHCLFYVYAEKLFSQQILSNFVQGENLARELGAAAYVEFSANSGLNVKNVFDKAIDTALFPPKTQTQKQIGEYTAWKI